MIDYDSSTETLYVPLQYKPAEPGKEPKDPFEDKDDSELLSNPHFHAQNVYAIIMRTLARFEFALGRHVSWSFRGHQIQVAPHAFADTNAFYSKRDQALMFGYFPTRKGRGHVFSCLSHDVVAHETTHALVDGLRERYTDPSSPEQAAFHEGFADIVALLSIFSLQDVVSAALDLGGRGRSSRLISRSALKPDKLRNSVLLGLANQMGEEISGVRGDALRRSANLKASRAYIHSPEFAEPHRRGEILVAAMMNAFLEVWVKRLEALGEKGRGSLDRGRVIEEGANAAEHLLTMAIRALDYAPPTDLEFCDFLSALLTADFEMHPSDVQYGYRKAILKSFHNYGIDPTSKVEGPEKGIWEPPETEGTLVYDRTHFESMQRDPDEVFRFVWENRKVLGLFEDAYTKVQSVRPCLRIGFDGFALRETVAEYIQTINLRAKELTKYGISVPEGMPLDQEVTLYGGGALIFDQYGLLKFHVRNKILNVDRQTRRLKYLWEYGFFDKGSSGRRHFAALHRQRMMGITSVASVKD